MLYGTCSRGGTNDNGTLFSYNPTTNVFQKLYDFGNSFGIYPEGDLLIDYNEFLIGMTKRGGNNDKGVVFKYSINSGNYQVVSHFDSTNGSYPSSNLLKINHCNEPSQPNLFTNEGFKCIGDSIQINIAINDTLGGASTWNLYAESCQGTLLQSNDSGKFMLPFNNTTKYYVSSAGGCAVMNFCDSIEIDTLDDTVYISATGQLRSNQSNVNYRWFDCNSDSSLINANSQFFTPNTLGSYAVELSSGSCIDTSLCIAVTGLEEFSTNNFSIYPNPTQNQLIIKFNYVYLNETLQIIDISGKVVKTLKIKSLREVVNVSNLHEGIYFVHFIEKNLLRKIIVLR
jgi:uncharacterized repeat protein (TIGR03803 family)